MLTISNIALAFLFGVVCYLCVIVKITVKLALKNTECIKHLTTIAEELNK